VSAVVVNRCTPAFGHGPSRRPRGADLAALYDNLREMNATAHTERRHAARLLADPALPPEVPTTFVPTLPGDVHTMDALRRIRALLFDEPQPAAT
jgi:hypothetical protein